MKIGIVTYHRTLNYGACLQAIATRTVLEKLGHEAYYVDYWPKYHSKVYKTFSLTKFLKLPSFGWKLRYLLSFPERKRRNDSFAPFLTKYIIPYCHPIEDNYDVVIYGSDQIWRKQKALGTYNPFYFGDNKIKTKHHISYAASMGVLPDNNDDINKLKQLLSNFDKISVREENLFNIVRSLGYKNVQLTLDPTLLLTSQEWDKIIETEQYTGSPYVLIYSIGKPDAFNLKSIHKYAFMRNLKVKILCGTPEASGSKEYITTANPYEFLKLIRNADSVFTSSFHGLVFSLLYHKNVYASFKQNSNRAKTLLDSISLSERLLVPKIEVPDLKEIDYDSVQEKLQFLKDSSYNFLATINQ